MAVAECKLTFMDIPVHGFGKAAIQGMAQALRELTGLEVDVSGSAVRLVWAGRLRDMSEGSGRVLRR